jgi:transcriptional regulator with XRE-family HTH domain
MKLTPRIESIISRFKEEGRTIEGQKASLSALARVLGVHRQQLSLWSKGKAIPRPETIFYMAHVLNVRPEELYEFEPPTQEEKEAIIREYDEREKQDILRRRKKKEQELRKQGLPEELILDHLRLHGLTKYDHELAPDLTGHSADK